LSGFWTWEKKIAVCSGQQNWRVHTEVRFFFGAKPKKNRSLKGGDVMKKATHAQLQAIVGKIDMVKVSASVCSCGCSCHVPKVAMR